MGLFKSRKQKPSPKPGAQEPQAQQENTYSTHHTNLSTTSTLVSDSPSPSNPERPTAQRTNSYEAFLSHARESEERRVRRLEKEERVLREWVEAQERRINGGDSGGGRMEHWPRDPWRGGFGPPASSSTRTWLGQNGLVRK